MEAAAEIEIISAAELFFAVVRGAA